MGDSPDVTSLEREQFGTSHVENLPPIVPCGRVLLSVRINEVWPQLLLVLDHRGEPVLSIVSVSDRKRCSNAGLRSLTSQVLE